MAERETHPEDEEIGVCHVCGERFESQELLLAHLAHMHPDDVLPQITEA
jgi:hypothetical protein